MTDITDQDRRDMLEWADYAISYEDVTSPRAQTVARYILATVEAPAPTLAEEWRDMLEKQDAGEAVSFSGLLARTVQMEQDAEDRQEWNRSIAEQTATIARERDEARAEVESLAEERYRAQYTLAEVTNARDSLREDYDNARTEVERLTAERLDRNSEMRMLTSERNEALIEAERLAAENEQLRRTDNFKEFRDKFLTVQKDAESNAETIDPADVPLPMPPGDIPGTALPINISAIVPDPTTPSPADVKPGEAWIVEVEGERRTALKDGDRYVSWNTVDTEGCPVAEANNSVTLLHRLVPEPRTVRYEPKEK